MNHQAPEGSVKVLRLPALQKKLGGISKATIYRMMKEDLLPRNIKIGSRSSGWLEHEVDEVLLAR